MLISGWSDQGLPLATTTPGVDCPLTSDGSILHKIIITIIHTSDRQVPGVYGIKWAFEPCAGLAGFFQVLNPP